MGRREHGYFFYASCLQREPLRQTVSKLNREIHLQTGEPCLKFSLELLNAHEVVNDSIGDINFAAVW